MPKERNKQIIPTRLSNWIEKRDYLTREFAPASHEEFIKQRMITHLRVNRSIIHSIPNTNGLINDQPNTSIRNMFEMETMTLIKSRGEVDEAKFPTSADLELLTDEQLVELQRNLVFDQISNSESPLSTMLAIDLQLARQTGLFIKYLDYFGLKRPDRLDSVWGDGKHYEPKATETGKVGPWIMESSLGHLKLESYPGEIRSIVASILDESYVNEVAFQDAPIGIRQRDFEGKPNSSIEADLLHQVINLSMRIDKVTNVAKDYLRLPSSYELSRMEYKTLISLYKNFTTYFLHLFQSKEVQESTVEWYGKSLNAKEFLTTTLEHVMLHQGSLQFFEMLNI